MPRDPVTNTKWNVRGSEHIGFLADKCGYGDDLDTLWKNAGKKDDRKNPLILYHGKPADGTGCDVLDVPAPVVGTSSGAVNADHDFVAGSTELFLRLRVLDENFKKLAAGSTWKLEGVALPALQKDNGTFDGGPMIEVKTKPVAQKGKLTVTYKPEGSEDGDDPVNVVFNLQIGRLDPVDDTTVAPDDKYTPGVQQRLNNLGFGAGKVDGAVGPVTEGALGRFQKLYPDGDAEQVADKPVAGAKTRGNLEKVHDQAVDPPAPS